MGFQLVGLVGLMDNGPQSSAYTDKRSDMSSYPSACPKKTQTRDSCPPNSGGRFYVKVDNLGEWIVFVVSERSSPMWTYT